MSVKRPYSLQSQLLLLCRAFGEFLRYLKTQNASFRDSRHSLHDTRTPKKTSKLHLNDATLIPSDQYIQHHQNPFSPGDQNTAQASNLTNFHFSLSVSVSIQSSCYRVLHSQTPLVFQP